jgi:hypothetical protein
MYVLSLARLSNLQISGWGRLGNLLIAASLVGLIWVGYIGGLLSFRLNY